MGTDAGTEQTGVGRSRMVRTNMGEEAEHHKIGTWNKIHTTLDLVCRYRGISVISTSLTVRLKDRYRV